ncbi:MAG: DinB family protein [Cytophagaceae bacterium]|nr:DinB family protein [Cytophagaceae bacterium]MBK9509311.1 DinB family protein [Cytophagaceae bacterium]MBK9933692.1 DinB family protein [Cytophagaceae bacterium]MBL0302594.1 DinB family protein [Cytophagaceae bacterium]MBL0325420.1 DinB family protein [Cytophagaceae bacterium]
MSALPEIWLTCPVPEVPALLQPVAHALLQVQRELKEILVDFPEQKLWEKPKGMASVGFHLQHLSGVLDRLFTYAKSEVLTETQLLFLKNEGMENAALTIEKLIQQFDLQVAKSISQLKNTQPETLTEVRFVGRKQIPSTHIGLLFHATEHSTRHLGQLLVTVNFSK